MIKLLLSGKQLLLFIIITWSLLAFVSYNVLTVQAVEKYDIRKMKFVNDDLDDYGLKKIALEQACKDNGGQWKQNAWCKFDKIGGNDEIKFEHEMAERGLDYYYYDFESGNDEWQKIQNEKYEKSLKGEQEYEKYVAELEEIAADEDAICDNEDADTTDIKLCMSDKREQQIENIEKTCDEVDGQMTKDGCVTDSDGPKADKFNDELMKLEEETGYPSKQEEVIEDWGNTVSEEEPTKIDGLFEDELEREDVDKYCDASEDYKKHPKECDRYYKIVEKLEEDIKKRVDEYNQNTPVEDRPVTCDGGMTYSAAGTVCGDS